MFVLDELLMEDQFVSDVNKVGILPEIVLLLLILSLKKLFLLSKRNTKNRQCAEPNIGNMALTFGKHLYSSHHQRWRRMLRYCQMMEAMVNSPNPHQVRVQGFS
ncbi:hypothetical protein XENOCAPTIV_021236 [Xenoophorus captivus]|uniref:Uncharacterized protein n=1 Tax=Xenoophorus captivus TaxID=1517983 RepID=A0ABV0R5J9_9TELE